MSRRTEKNVGLIGLGIIGQRVADNVRRRGFHVFVWNRTPRPYPNFVGSPAEIAELCDYIQLFVSDDEALLEVVQQMKQSLNAHHVVMAHSTVAPHTMRAAAEIVQRRGAQLLDAPFTGSKEAAGKGELVYYIGGDEAAYRRARPVLQASSKEIIEIGEIGQATTIKIATNMVTAATVQAAAEALALVHNSGLSLDKFATAMRGNGSNSGTLTMKLPKMLEGDFEPHFSVKHMLKDVQIASRLARSYGLNLAATEAAHNSLLEAARRGRGDDDYSSLVQFFFPEGPPTASTGNATELELQATLSGLEQQEAASPPSAAEATAGESLAQEEVQPPAASAEEAVSEEIRDGEKTGERTAPAATAEEAASEETSQEPVEAKVITPESKEDVGREVETVVNGTDKSEMAASPGVELPVETTPADGPPEEEAAPPRGFLSRLFGKGMDY